MPKYNGDSITELISALCDSSLSGFSWKRRSLCGVSQEGIRRTLWKCAFRVLLSKLFQGDTSKAAASSYALASTPARNKILMLSFNLRVAGCQEEAERLECFLAQLHEGASSALTELDAVLELLALLAGSAPQPPTSLSQGYMCREWATLRRPPLGSYQSVELQCLEARAWVMVCQEEWAALRGFCGTLSLMDAPPGTGLLALRGRSEQKEGFEKETRLSLFGALQHTRTSSLDIRLDLPPVPSNADVTGLVIRVPHSLDQSEDEGFQSASNLTPDSQSEPSPELDIWEALRTFEPKRHRCWENVGCPPGQRESQYLSEGGREAFDQLYRLWEGEIRVLSSTQTPSPLLPLPLNCQSLLVKDLLNVLIGVASTTFTLNAACVQFDVRPGVCVSGASPESASRLLGELAQYGTHYLRLSRFSIQSAHKRGLVFQAFAGSLRRYLLYYRACVLCTPATFSLLTISFLFRKLGRQLRYLSELCCVDGASGVGQATFPVGVKLLSYLYNEAQSNCSNENYPVLLSLLKSSCEPYTRFVSDWVYSGVFRDVYGEFMIQVNEDYLSCRDKHFWVQGYTLISQDVEECVPVFLRHIASDVYVCGKTINLLKICCPQHYICWSELPVPPIAVTFSRQEVEEIERHCAIYRGRMERIGKHSAISREEQARRTEQACQELINQARETAAKTLDNIRGRQVSQRLAEEAKKRQLFEELRQQLELQQEWRITARQKEQEDDYGFARELRDREKRLQALEKQLENRARKELIARYSRLSKEAAKREQRAMWRVQRMRLEEVRVRFLQQDKKNTKTLLERCLLGQKGDILGRLPSDEASLQQAQETLSSEQGCENHHPEAPVMNMPPLPPPVHPACPTIREGALILHKPLQESISKTVTQALQDIESDLYKSPKVPVSNTDYDLYIPQGPLEVAHIGLHLPMPHTHLGENVLGVKVFVSTPRSQSHTMQTDFVLGQRTPELLLSEHQVMVQPSPLSEHVGYSSNSTAEQRGGNTHVAFGLQSTAPSEPRMPAAVEESHMLVSLLQTTERKSSDMQATERESSDMHVKVHTAVAQRTEGLSARWPESVLKHAEEKLVKVRVIEQTTLDMVVSETSSTYIHDQVSDTHTEVVSDKSMPLPSLSMIGHVCHNKSGIREGELTLEVKDHLSSPDIHGHASDAHIRAGEHVSVVTVPIPTPSIHRHASDAHIKVGEHVSEVTVPIPTPSVHGHASDAHIRVGENVSGVTVPISTPNIHGHASDAHIKVGENVSEVMATIPLMNIHGHASDAHIKVGEFISDVMPSRPRWNKHGHSSDCNLTVGCVVPERKPMPVPLLGSGYRCYSDSKVGIGSVDIDTDPSQLPKPSCDIWPSTDSTMDVRFVAPGTEPLPPSVLGVADGNPSDTTQPAGTDPLPQTKPPGKDKHSQDIQDSHGSQRETSYEFLPSNEGLTALARGLGLSSGHSSEDDYLLSLAAQYQVEQYQDTYSLLTSGSESALLQQVMRGPYGLPVDPSLHRATDTTAVQLSEMVSLPVLMKHSVTMPLITHVSLVNKAVVDYFFVELGVERHFEALKHFLLMEDGEFAQSLSDLLFEKLGNGQTPGELLTPLVLNSILSKALQYSVHGDSRLAANFTFALRFLPEAFHPHAPDALNCLELRYKVDWPLNIIITDSCMNKYNRLFSFLLQLKHMVWTLRDVWFHLKRTALVQGAGRSVQFRQLQLYRHEMQHFVKVIQGYIANQILQVSWSEFTQKLSSASDLDTIHHTHSDYLNRAIFRGLLTEKAAPVMNIIHSIFSLILKFRAQLIAQPWGTQEREAVHPNFIAMQQSYNTFKYYSHFLFKVVTKLVNKGYQPHLEDFLLRINFNNYYKDS
ncbi:gamma-tubulin complex component 6 [Chanos chanos]|uniref:Gamma-tubulin complex component 6 n=1 Tax=Chanos chanos TaxID=29144 RepID=A0A6J2VHD7_CHACN|nr:gamma-tubulin complex component 6 [Chanos chanos]